MDIYINQCFPKDSRIFILYKGLIVFNWTKKFKKEIWELTYMKQTLYEYSNYNTWERISTRVSSANDFNHK